MNPLRARASVPDEQRFEEIYAQNVRAISGYVRSRTDEASALDALSRTFEIAWRRLPDVPGEPRPWLFGVARRVLADQRRATGRQESLVQRLSESLAAQAGDHAELTGEREQLLRALDALEPTQREALLLVLWDGLSHREAAAALGCSTGAVTVRIHRARKRLRVALARPDSHPVGSMKEPSSSLNRSPKETL